MSDFADELRKLNSPPKTDPIQSRKVIQQDVDRLYDIVKYRMKHTSAVNGCVRINIRFSMIPNNFRYCAKFSDEGYEVYYVYGRRDEMMIFLSLLDERCIYDGILFYMLRYSDWDARDKYMEKVLRTTNEMLTSATTKGYYRAVFEINI